MFEVLLGDWIVAAIFYAVFSSLCICGPTWTPSVHLRVQSLECQVLLASATELVCSTHILRATRFICIETDNMKPYAQVTYLKAQLSIIN